MTDILLLISSIVAGSLRVVIGFVLIHRLLSAQKLSRKSVAVGLVGMLILAILPMLVNIPTSCKIAMETLLIAVCANRLQEAELRMSLFVSIFYEIGISFWHFLLSAWMGVLFRSQDFLTAETLAGQSAVWLLHGMMILLTVLISRKSSLCPHTRIAGQRNNLYNGKERGQKPCQQKNENMQHHRDMMKHSKPGLYGWSPSKAGPAGK